MPNANLGLLKELCSVPTAPFAEHRVLDWVDAFARQRRLACRADRFGNRLITVGPAGTRAPRLVFVAHLDHPGMVAERMEGRGRLVARFHGGVYSSYVTGQRVRFFNPDGSEVAGKIETVSRASDRADFPAEVLVRLGSKGSGVARGAPGMFDQGTGRVKGGKFYSRVCDDLAGVAAVLAALDVLRRRRLGAPVAALLTRAEEEGFIGAMAAVKAGELISKRDRLISVECSAVQPYARQGDGVILRVGDRTSIFNSAFTFWMNQQCEALAKEDRTFRYQRSLMPGGSCEGTVFDAHGYTAGAVCVPLGNYHNMDRERKLIGPEYIDLSDWQNEVKLFVRLGEQAHDIDLKFAGLKSRLAKRFASMRKYL